MKEKVKCTTYFFAVLCGCIVAMTTMIQHHEEITSAARQGIELCASTMIPTIFPFLIVTSFLMRSKAIDYIGKIIDRAAKKIFKISGKAAAVFLISLFSGFPVGASLVSTMTHEKKLKKTEGARLMTCCVNAGPAFVISAVGAQMLKSKRAGIILFVSLTVSSIIILFLSGLFISCDDIQKKGISQDEFGIKDNFSSSFVKSVADATESMVSVCGWIIAFSCFTALLKEKMGVATLFLEVSIASKMSINFPLPVTALVIGWSGFCVHCQVFHAVIKTGMEKITFFFCRALNGALAAGICSILLRFFPCALQTFASVPSSGGVKMSANVTACAGLMLMCAILIVDFEETRNYEGQTLLKTKKSKKLKILRNHEKT